MARVIARRRRQNLRQFPLTARVEAEQDGHGNGTGSAKTLGLVLAGFLGVASFAMNGARAGEPMTPARACPDGQVAAAGTCVAVEEAKAKIDAIVREAMAKRDLKAVL